jgi:26S proteasome regulatory subunit N7
VILYRLVEEGGDWDRRTRLKDYEAYYLITLRKFDEAAKLLLETLSTFNATELMSLGAYVQLTTICALVALERYVCASDVVVV